MIVKPNKFFDGRPHASRTVFVSIVFVILTFGVFCAGLGALFRPEIHTAYRSIFSKGGEQKSNSIARLNKIGLQTDAKYREDSIVLVGDSIVELFEVTEHLPGNMYINRGIRGDTIHELIGRMDHMLHSNVRGFVVMIGINDFLKGRSIKQVESDSVLLIDKICNSGKPTIYFQMLPINSEKFKRIIIPQHPKAIVVSEATISAYNLWLRGKVEKCPTMTFVRLPSLIEYEKLRDEATYDGLHLSYAAHSELAKEILMKFDKDWIKGGQADYFVIFE